MNAHRWIGVVVALTLVACGSSGTPATTGTTSVASTAVTSAPGTTATTGAPPTAITVTSTAFTEGGTIPTVFTCQGQSVSPPLAWSGVPTSAASVAIVVDDPDAPSGTFTHWILVGLAPSRTSLAQGEVPAGATAGKASNGTAGYVGMCPPAGPAHHYHFTVYAERTTPDPTVAAIQAGAIASGRLTGLYARQ